MYRLVWLIPLLPLAGAAVNGLLGRRLRFSEKVVGAVAVGSVALAFVLSVAAVWSYGYGAAAMWPAPYVTKDVAYTWIPGGVAGLTLGEGAREGAGGGEVVAAPGTAIGAGEEAVDSGRREVVVAQPTLGVGRASEAPGRGAPLEVEWSYQLDPLSSIFMLVVTGVGLCIFVFATGYMRGDAGFYRFFAYLGLFMFSMLVLVMGSNFLMLFVGWEGVGLCSYLLIGYYFDRREAGDAARKAFITNRVGDFGLVLALAGIIAAFGSTQYTEVLAQAGAYPLEPLGAWGLMSWLALGLFVGACGKSAQMPLHVWLPDAMAGPTPVSALIHAATMVTAGLYLLARTNVIFQHSRTMMLVVATVGALTALFAATVAVTQTDIKKVLAYSTVSQLGLMFLACGVGAFVAAIFHVMTHAFFKALLFLGAGSVIHGMHHEQDVRRMGGLKKHMPKTYWTFFFGWLAICGVIPLSGFWSKDEILWGTASTELVPGGWLLWLAGLLAATLTAFYMTRLVALTFWGRERFLEIPAGAQADEAHAHAYDLGEEPHAAREESAGDRPHHEPGEHVGVAHLQDTEGVDVREHYAAGGRDVHDEHDPEDRHRGEGHGSVVPHESPASMWVPLAVLAALSIVGGLVGVGPAFRFLTGAEHPGGRVNIVNWLNPVVWDPATKQFDRGAAGAHAGNVGGASARTEGAHAASELSGADKAHAPDAHAGFNLAHAAESALGSHTAAEWLFILAALFVAGLGIFLGWLFYAKNLRLPELWGARLAPLYRASLNKYWIDELYGLLFTRRTLDAARAVQAADAKALDGAVNASARLTRRLSLLTGKTDFYVVDGLVNGVAAFVKGLMSPLLRAAQTGLTANYALVMVLGLVAAVALFFARDIMSAVRGMFS